MKNEKTLKTILLMIFAVVVSFVQINQSNQGQVLASEDVELVMLSDGEGISAFTIQNLMPGDVEYQNFDLMITHEENMKINYFFNPDEDCSLALLENLQIEVYLSQMDKVIFEGSFSDFELNEEYIYLVQSETNESCINYEVTISLPEEAGNDCMNQKISGQFIWTSEEVDVVPDDSEDDVYTPETEDDSETGDASETGDNSDYVMYLIALSISVLGVIALLYRRNRRGSR